MDDDALPLPDPGMMTGDSIAGLGNLEDLGTPTLSLPMDDDDSLSGDASLDALPSLQGGSVAQAAQSAPSSGYDWSSLFGGLLGGAGAAATNAFITIPAVTSAQNSLSTTAANNAIAEAEAGLTGSSSSLTTLIIWGLIAWGIITLMEEGKRG